MGTMLLSGVGSGAGAGASDAELFAAARDGDPDAREELVCRFLPMARRLAWRYRRGAESPDDLVQVASLALVKAIERFDSGRGIPFSGYAVPTIVGELKRHLRDTRWSVYVPQRMRERVLEVDRAAESLRCSLGRAPTVEEVAHEARIEAAQVADALEAATAYECVSLDSPAYGSQADDAGATFLDSLGSHEERYDMVEYVVTIEPAVRALPARQRVILWLRFHEDMTQAEIATRLDMSQMHVSRLLRQALARLREVARVRHAV
jgi:RNA polymerase sigma-B factor